MGTDPSNDIVLRAGSAPAQVGVFDFRQGTTTFHAAEGVEVKQQGRVVRSAMLTPGPGTGAAPADALVVGTFTLWLHQSGARFAVRVRDPQSPLRTGFTGWQMVSDQPHVPDHRTLLPYDTSKAVTVPNIMGDLEHYTSPGIVQFELQGQTLHLQPVLRGRTDYSSCFATRRVGTKPMERRVSWSRMDHKTGRCSWISIKQSIRRARTIRIRRVRCRSRRIDYRFASRRASCSTTNEARQSRGNHENQHPDRKPQYMGAKANEEERFYWGSSEPERRFPRSQKWYTKLNPIVVVNARTLRMTGTACQTLRSRGSLTLVSNGSAARRRVDDTKKSTRKGLHERAYSRNKSGKCLIAKPPRMGAITAVRPAIALKTEK